jgi:hypothetical protein
MISYASGNVISTVAHRTHRRRIQLAELINYFDYRRSEGIVLGDGGGYSIVP